MLAWVRRGTGEVAGAVRARDGISHQDEAGAEDKVDGKTAHVEKHGLEVSVVTGTPGAKTFETLFLARVCQVKD